MFRIFNKILTQTQKIKDGKNIKNDGVLIKIDFKDDPDYIYGALESALKSADFILIDGYFRSKRNMLASVFFLEKYKYFIEEWKMPSFADSGLVSLSGRLLIKTNGKAKKLKKNLSDYSYKEIESFYDKNYYLNDCGGYESFKINSTSLDVRLYVVQCLVDAGGGRFVREKILDLGCGRGELSYAMAKSGADVLAIDYSAASIAIAEKNYGSRLYNLNYKKVDFFELDPGLLFDKIVASDLVEHIDAALFEKFLGCIAAHLNKGGKFILHTAPNKYVYSYKYKRDRLMAEEIGLFLPENPRSFYESLMHVNEQMPGSLKRALKKYFKYVCVWTANTEEPAGDLQTKPSKSGLANHRSIFAIASDDAGAISKEDIVNNLIQGKLNDISGVSLEFLPDFAYPKKIKKNTINIFRLKLINNGAISLKSLGTNPVNLSYHIKDASGNYIVHDGIRTGLPSIIYPNRAVEIDLYVCPPDGYTGTAYIEFTMVQEGIFWFENKKNEFARTLKIKIV